MSNDWQHVYPVADLKPHQMTTECHCDPHVDWKDRIVVHNSYDHREVVERAKDLLKNGIK